MKILIFGASGMLGSNAFITYQALGDEVYGTARQPQAVAQRFGFEKNYLFPFSLSTERALREQERDIEAIIRKVQPDLVLNAIGAIKQKDFAPTEMILLNGVFPWMLLKACDAVGCRLITVSTDCVFSGRPGEELNHYSERSVPDAMDLYGRSKLLGEPSGENVLAVRTSIIGLEPSNGKGLLAWFLRQESCDGYSKAYWNGVTTFTLARRVRELILDGEQGLVHIYSPQSVSKLELLEKFKAAFNQETIIRPNPSVEIDRTLSSERFDAASIPQLDNQIQELATIASEAAGFGSQ